MKTEPESIISSGIPAADLSAATGPLSGAGSISPRPQLRAAVYIDGFNLFHAIDDLDQPHLKWLDLHKVATALVGKTQILTRVVWCSAEHRTSPDKVARYRAYREALKTTGVIAAEGHFVMEERHCPKCKETHLRPVEKQGDLHVALHLISDAYEDVYDIAYLVTTDSDQAATARLFKQKFAAAPKPKRLVTVSTPGRFHSREIFQLANGRKAIEIATIEESLFPQVIRGPRGDIVRPAQYDPPNGWQPPSQRTKVTAATVKA